MHRLAVATEHSHGCRAGTERVPKGGARGKTSAADETRLSHAVSMQHAGLSQTCVPGLGHEIDRVKLSPAPGRRLHLIHRAGC